jgi:hypothetical protein
LALVASAFAKPAEVVQNDLEVEADGFKYAYEIDDGTAAQAVGTNNNHEGSYKWTSPEGENFEVKYVADENGYQPTGAHIPVPHPLILKAIEYIRAHPPAERK